MKYIRYFTDIKLSDSSIVGGKNASLGEMIGNLSTQGIEVPLGFALTTQAYWHFLAYNKLEQPLKKALYALNATTPLEDLQKAGAQARALLLAGTFDEAILIELKQAYTTLSQHYDKDDLDVAVRSSATAEDLPQASFAGQQDTYLNIQGFDNLVQACKKCIASLFTDRAIVYRIKHRFDHFKVAMSVGVQKMVRSDRASSGVLFTLDTETGFKDVVVITSSYGLGEAVVQGSVNPDEFHVHKQTLEQGFKPIIKKYRGSKKIKLVYARRSHTRDTSTKMVKVLRQDQAEFSLTDTEILALARLAVSIEKYYSDLHKTWSPMDIEWAKDGYDQKLYIMQARPETVHVSGFNPKQLIRYHLVTKEKPKILTQGQAIGEKIVAGTARVLKSITDKALFNKGDILVTSMTDPDWLPLMRRAGAIITNEGGRTCHAAIVSRELGIPAIIGTDTATHVIMTGTPITVDCSKGSIGYVYNTIINFKKEIINLEHIPQAPVQVMLNIADSSQAYKLSFLPVDGVGLARTEFIIGDTIKIHPMAAVQQQNITGKKLRSTINKLAQGYNEDWQSFFISTLAQDIGTIAAAFYPKPVLLRMSDFKSNEYRNLLGGSLFEPVEENPMIGFRGAVRYCHKNYASGFSLECTAFKKARQEMGFKNLKLLIPFVRTLDEAACTIKALESYGLIRGEDNLEIFMMCEVPSNIILLKEFGAYFDGFSIGSNDLTQLTLGVDRDSGLLGRLFDERDQAVYRMLEMALTSAHKAHKYIGICGQAPSDFPEIADFLIAHGIKSLSLNADSVIPFLLRYKK